MAEPKAPNMPARIYGDILSRILESAYQEGSRLPTGHAPAERFATSRPTVREALVHVRDFGTAAKDGRAGDAQRLYDAFMPLENLRDKISLIRVLHDAVLSRAPPTWGRTCRG